MTGKLTLRVVAFPEFVLLAVAGSEDVVADQVENDDADGTGETEIDLVKGEVTGLEGVGEGHPCEITD